MVDWVVMVRTEEAQRYQELVSRCRAGTLSPGEYQELLDLTDEVERLQAERIDYLAKLADLRGKPLEVLMAELGNPALSE